ncbi:MAG: leucine-rich repeat domain-containing protein [Paludibacteraceae bacterium]|nr:leucine-rich repeat domain-containing protein [Paludibacteraceae bacterium]
MRKLVIFITLLMLSAGLWAENPPELPAGEISYNGLYFRCLSNECVELVKNNDKELDSYSGNIVVPKRFEFIDTQQKRYVLKVIQIGADAFMDCLNLTSVTLPTTIEAIGNNAFANCENLKFVTCLGDTPPTIADDIFSEKMGTIVYVPRGTTVAYKEAWSVYADRIRLTDLEAAKENAINSIETARQGIQNTNINNWIDGAINDINAAGIDAEKVDDIKNQILTMINIFQDGKTEGVEEALGEMGKECTGCPAVKVKKGTTSVTFYAPERVEYIKTQSE